MKLKATVLILVFCLLACVCAVGCGDGIDGDEAQSKTVEFLRALKADDYEAASALLHPDVSDDLQARIEAVEADEALNFNSEMTITAFTGFNSVLYDSNVDGARYVLYMDITIDGVEAEAAIEFVRNDVGFGIYSFEFDR